MGNSFDKNVIRTQNVRAIPQGANPPVLLIRVMHGDMVWLSPKEVLVISQNENQLS